MEDTAMTKKKQRALPASYLDNFQKKVREATVILYKQNYMGDMIARGTATAFWQHKNLCYFLTASHCVLHKEITEENI